jgi:hypothetical protein
MSRTVDISLVASALLGLLVVVYGVVLAMLVMWIGRTEEEEVISRSSLRGAPAEPTFRKAA